MKNKLLAILFIGVLLVCITGCEKKKKFKVIEVTGPRVVCSYTTNEDGIKTENKITLKFNSDKYVNYQLLESTMTFKEKDTYKSYVDAYKESEENMELGEGVEWDYKANNKEKKISTYMLYNESVFDYSKAKEEEKANYLASTLIKKYEDSTTTCEFIELTREDLGLENE